MVNRTSADSKSLLGDSYLCSKYTTYSMSQWKVFTIAIYSTKTIMPPTCRRILIYVCHGAHVKTYSANTPSSAFTEILQKFSRNITAKKSLTRGDKTTPFVIHNMFYRKIILAGWCNVTNKMIHVTCIPWSSWHFFLAVQCRLINNRSFPKTVGANTEQWPCYFYGIALYHK